MKMRLIIADHLFTLLTAAIMLSMLSGCAGMMVDAIERSQATDKPYAEMAANLSPPSNGDGRLFIYRTEASTKTSLVVRLAKESYSMQCGQRCLRTTQVPRYLSSNVNDHGSRVECRQVRLLGWHVVSRILRFI